MDFFYGFNSDDIITFYLYLMNKLRRILIKIHLRYGHVLLKSGLTGLTGFLVTFRSVNFLVFYWLIRKLLVIT